MVTALILFSSLATASQGSVTLIPPSESQFVNRDKTLDALTQPDVIESRDKSPQGFFILREEFYGDDLYSQTVQDLQGTTVSRIIRRNADGSFTDWTMSGRTLPHRTTPAMASALERLKDGELAIEIAQPQRRTKGPARTDSNLILLPGTTHSTGNQTIQVFGIINPPKARFVDVKFLIVGSTEAGKLEKEIGSKATVDGIEFKVTDGDKTYLGSEKGWRRILLSKTIPHYTYSIFATMDWDDYDKNGGDRRAHNFETGSRDAQSGKSLKPGEKELTVDGSKPSKFWSSLRIVRKTQMTGYIGHLPTQPLTTP